MEDHARVVLEAQELRAMMDKAAEDGAKRALAAVGLHDEDAAEDIRDLRRLMEDWRAAKASAIKSFVNTLVIALFSAAVIGIWWNIHRGAPPR
jgi:2-iminoacetate synthase ThiH